MSLSPFEELPGDGEGSGGGGSGGGFTPPGPYPDQLPGLQGNLRNRYTFNGVVSDQIPASDFLNEVVFPAARMYITHGANGKLRLHNKKPVDFGLATTALSIGQSIIPLDDVSGWVGNLKGFAIIDPHTNKSEAREVIAAKYSIGQNSVTLTTNEATDIVITGFTGCNGASTPAIAEVQINAVVDATAYEIELDGITIPFTGSASDTPETVALALVGIFKGNPKLNRKFSFTAVGDVMFIQGRFGTLEFDAPLELLHDAPVADPTAHPVLSEVSTGPLYSGPYKVAYTFKDPDGNQTLLSPYSEGTIAANKDIEVDAVTPPSGCTVCWYITVSSYSNKIRFHSENDGSSFIFGSLPKLDDPVPPDINRTGTEVMRVVGRFSDREETRASATRSNVLKATYEWSLADQKKRHNRIDVPYRDASDDYRRIELRVHDKKHQAKIRKVEKKEINGSGIDNFFQASRIAYGELAESRDANFKYKWESTREALLFEEGDVVAITDDGSGVHNLPVMIESRQIKLSGLPTVSFVAPIFANTLYDDSIVEREISLGLISGGEPAGPDTEAPTAPVLVSASPDSGSAVTLTWTASTDNVGVSGYQYRVDGGSWVSAGNSLTKQVTGLTAETEYDFEVRAYDASLNYSPASNLLSATTEAGAWTPSNIPSAVHWWEASAITGLSDTDPVASWLDLIGSADLASSGSARPTYKTNSGDPYVEFDGSNDTMLATIDDLTDLTMVAVYERVSDTSFGRLLNTSGNGLQVYTHLGFNQYVHFNFGGIDIASVASPTGDMALFVERIGSAGRVRFDGDEYTATVNTTATGTGLRLGTDNDGTSALGNVRLKFLLFCNDEIGSDFANLEEYLLTKFGVTL